MSEISSLYLASVAAQDGLSLTWSQTPKTGFLVTRLICISSLSALLTNYLKKKKKKNNKIQKNKKEKNKKKKNRNIASTGIEPETSQSSVLHFTTGLIHKLRNYYRNRE